jgi:DNA-binding NtrC family response regulator
LENAVFRSVVLAEGDEVGLAELPQIAPVARGLPPAPSLGPDMPSATSGSIAPAQQPAADPGRIAPPSGSTLPLLDAQGEVRALDEVESEIIRFAIAHYGGQMSEVARRLQIGRSTLYRKLDSLGVAAEITPDSEAESVGHG